MRFKKFIVFVLSIILVQVLAGPISENGSLVVLTTETPIKNNGESSSGEPKIYSLHLDTNVTNRFATTLVTSKVKNPKQTAAEVAFSMVLPENAFISEFIMEIDGKSYKAYVKEKEEAKQIYDQAVASGLGAAHVEVSARDSRTFTVSVNVEPQSKAIFKLTYEELLKRTRNIYDLVLNIHPGQPVKDFKVEVHINETRPLTLVQTPNLRTGNEIKKNNPDLEPQAEIIRLGANEAVIKFSPNVEQQKQFAQHLGTDKEDGLQGQFVVEYDVERDPHGGEVLVKDGYFVHFFAPTELDPLPKHVVFVLDHSGSMSGRKIEQLIEAMKNILGQLSHEDIFNIVRFSYHPSVWNEQNNSFVTMPFTRWADYKNPKNDFGEKYENLFIAAKAIEQNRNNAKKAIEDQSDLGSTNIIVGLEVGLHIISKQQLAAPKKYQPLMVFLTDGQPNVGLFSTDEIIKEVTELNSGPNRASIFSLSFGEDADKKFLEKLSLRNLGFSRHIYEAADSSLQLEEFYKSISSPLLNNVVFKYIDETSDVTKTHHPLLFGGSELVVAGKTHVDKGFVLPIDGWCITGIKHFVPKIERPVSSLERLWAYLTTKQILQERETVDNKTELTKKALDLALKYSFVTAVSSLVVVKPNQTDNVEPLITSGKKNENYPQPFYGLARGPPGLAGSSSSSFPMRGFARPLSYDSGFGPVPPASGFFVSPPIVDPVSYDSEIDLRIELTEPALLDLLPQWLEDKKLNNQTITTLQGTYELGSAGIISNSHQGCNRTPLNQTGECTIIFDCPEIYQYLTDESTYLQYFCPLGKYAGVCCPKNQPSN